MRKNLIAAVILCAFAALAATTGRWVVNGVDLTAAIMEQPPYLARYVDGSSGEWYWATNNVLIKYDVDSDSWQETNYGDLVFAMSTFPFDEAALSALTLTESSEAGWYWYVDNQTQYIYGENNVYSYNLSTGSDEVSHWVLVEYCYDSGVGLEVTSWGRWVWTGLSENTYYAYSLESCSSPGDFMGWFYTSPKSSCITNVTTMTKTQ